MNLLTKLVALANRPGTPAEGEAARRHADRLAGLEGLSVVRSSDGETLIVLDHFHADLHAELTRLIREGERRRALGELPS